MSAIDLLKLGAFILGAGLGIKFYLAFKKAGDKVQDAEISEQKAKIDALMGRASDSKKEYEANLESWNDFVRRTRDVSKRGEGE